MRNFIVKLKSELESKSSRFKMLIGWDGFIDEIIHVVDRRMDAHNYKKIKTIKQFSTRIKQAAGFSANFELVTKRKKIGGNGVIMADALLKYKQEVSYIGALGFKEINSLFHNFASECSTCVSLANPGYTEALEFDDGKIMLGKHTSLPMVNWNTILVTKGLSFISNLIKEVDFIAFNNWTMLEGMNDIVTNCTLVLQHTERSPLIFSDLADPAKRKNSDIRAYLRLLEDLNKTSPVILGLNEKESRHIAKILHIETEDTTRRAISLREKLNLHMVVIHPLHGAAAATIRESCWVDGPYTEEPVLTTGAGDNFNAGFCLGNLLQLSLREALMLGVYTSGYYVRYAHSPDIKELIDWLEEYFE